MTYSCASFFLNVTWLCHFGCTRHWACFLKQMYLFQKGRLDWYPSFS